MKVLFINTGPWGTGSFTVVQCLSNELLKLGHQVKIFFPDTNFDSTDKEAYYNNPERYEIWKFPIKSSKVQIATFPLMITDPHPRNKNAITFKQLTDEQLKFYEQELHKQLSLLIDSYKPDVIECHHIWYPCWVVHQMGLDYIVTAHHSDQLGFRYDQRAREKAIACAKGAKKIIAISESVREEVLELYQVDPSKVIVITNGYDKEVFKQQDVNKQELLQELGLHINNNARIISFAGKLSKTKGMDILLQANKLLDPDMNIHTIVLGTGELEELCKTLDSISYTLDRLHFVGHQPPELVAKIHNISLLSVMPSRTEGFGISCLEAMACGLPMVVSRSGGPEQFAVGKVIDAESAQQLADGIMEIIKLPNKDYQKLRKQARDKAEKYSMTTITQDHMDSWGE